MSRLFRRRSFNWLIIGLLAASFVPTSQAFAYQDTDESAAVAADSQDSSESPDEEVADAGEESDNAAAGGMAPGDIHWILYVIPVLGLIGLIFTFWKSSWVAAQEVGTEKMAGIAKNITDGCRS